MKKAQEIIADSLKEKKISQTELAKSMGEDVRLLNQQMKRVKDMKVSRFADVMEHLGYEVTLKDHEYRKVSPEYGKAIIEAGKPSGLFWYQEADQFVAIDTDREPALTATFSSAEDMKKWLNKSLADGRKISRK